MPAQGFTHLQHLAHDPTFSFSVPGMHTSSALQPHVRPRLSHVSSATHWQHFLPASQPDAALITHFCPAGQSPQTKPYSVQVFSGVTHFLQQLAEPQSVTSVITLPDSQTCPAGQPHCPPASAHFYSCGPLMQVSIFRSGTRATDIPRNATTMSRPAREFIIRLFPHDLFVGLPVE